MVLFSCKRSLVAGGMGKCGEMRTGVIRLPRACLPSVLADCTSGAGRYISNSPPNLPPSLSTFSVDISKKKKKLLKKRKKGGRWKRSESLRLIYTTRRARHIYQFDIYRPRQNGNATKSPDNPPLGQFRIPSFPAHKKPRPRNNRRRGKASEMAAMSKAKGIGTFGSRASSNTRLAELIIAIAGDDTDTQLNFLAFAAFTPGIAEMLVEIVEAAGDMEITAVEIF